MGDRTDVDDVARRGSGRAGSWRAGVRWRGVSWRGVSWRGRGERGAGVVEYALLLSLFAIVGMGGVQAVTAGTESAIGDAVNDVEGDTEGPVGDGPSVEPPSPPTTHPCSHGTADPACGIGGGPGGPPGATTTTTSTTTTTAAPTTTTTAAPTTTTTTTTSTTTTTAAPTTTTTTAAPAPSGVSVASASSQMHWGWNWQWNDPTTGNAAWVASVAFRNTTAQAQTLTFEVVRIRQDGTTSTSTVSGYYVGPNSTGWNYQVHDLALSLNRGVPSPTDVAAVEIRVVSVQTGGTTVPVNGPIVRLDAPPYPS